MLAARDDGYSAVVAGTTLGMMLANAPVVWLGERITRRLPLRAVHIASSLVFIGLGVGWASGVKPTGGRIGILTLQRRFAQLAGA